jgi:hypothetical protein
MFFVSSFHLGMCLSRVRFHYATYTVYVTINCYRMIEGYVVHASDSGGPAVWFGVLSLWDHVLKDTLFATQKNLSDAVAVSGLQGRFSA